MNKNSIKHETMLVFYITGDIDNVNEDGYDDVTYSNASSRSTLLVSEVTQVMGEPTKTLSMSDKDLVTGQPAKTHGISVQLSVRGQPKTFNATMPFIILGMTGGFGGASPRAALLSNASQTSAIPELDCAVASRSLLRISDCPVGLYHWGALLGERRYVAFSLA